MSKEITIGLTGASQIQHIKTALEDEYTVIFLDDRIGRGGKVLSKLIMLVRWTWSARKADVIYNVFTSKSFWIFARIAKLFGKKVINHWIGTDVLNLKEGIVDGKRLSAVDLHFVCFPALQKELASCGIEAVFLPVVPFNVDFHINKMPEEHAVLIYMPDEKAELYGYSSLCTVFSRFSDLKFYIVANSNKAMFEAYPNVEALGFLDGEEMEKLYDRVSVIIRNTRHDGLSMSILEALAKGKSVIWNYEFPHVLFAPGPAEICERLESVIRKPPSADVEAHEYVVKAFTKEKFLEAFDKAFGEIR